MLFTGREQYHYPIRSQNILFYTHLFKKKIIFSFKVNAERASHIMRERPQLPLNRSVFWIEHVLKYGGTYLRPSSADLHFWQMYLLDVYLAIVLLAYIAYRLPKIVVSLLRRFWKRRSVKCVQTRVPPTVRGTRRRRVMLSAIFISAVVCFLLINSYSF